MMYFVTKSLNTEGDKLHSMVPKAYSEITKLTRGTKYEMMGMLLGILAWELALLRCYERGRLEEKERFEQ